MSLQFNDAHFHSNYDRKEDLQDKAEVVKRARSSIGHRPSLPTLASSASIPRAPTTAISRPSIDTRSVIDTREGYDEQGDTDSLQSGLPSLTSVETDLADTLSQVILETNSIAPSRRSSWRPEEDETFSDDDLDRGLTAAEVRDLDEEGQVKDFLTRAKHFLILSAAGKPIYSRHGTEQVVPGYMAIIQAIMGFYQESPTPDALQSFSSADLHVVMLVRGPVYLVAISKLAEGENTLKTQLNFLYDVVLSTVTKSRMVKLFARGDNFDLGRLLSGSEQFMNTVCDQMTYDALHFDVLFGSLSVFRLRSTLRARINNILSYYRPKKTTEFLCGIIAVNKKLVAVLHPKGLTLYPADLRLVFETVWDRGMEENQDHWLPLCLPNFNSSGYLHVFVSFMAPSIATILISSSKDDFYALQEMKASVQKKLIKEGLIQDLIKAKHTQVSTETLQISGIVEHFIFRSREHVQHLMPPFPDLSTTPHKSETTGTHQPKRSRPRSRISRMTLMGIYEELISAGPPAYRLQVRHFPHQRASSDSSKTPNAGASAKTDEILALTWFTAAFELYVISRPFSSSKEVDGLGGGVGKIKVNELIGAANVIQQFVKREEKRVFVDDGVTF